MANTTLKWRDRWYSLIRRSYRKKIRIFAAILLLFCFLSRSGRSTNSSVFRQKGHPRVVVGIPTEWLQMRELVQASKNTWIKQLSYDIFYFVGRPTLENTTYTKESNMIMLPYDDGEYPPVNKTFAMWNYFYTKQIMNYDFFVAVDSDTYVNVPLLKKVIKRLTCRDCYVGYPSSGGKSKSRLGLQAPYCIGMGYVISRCALLQFGPHINTCRTSTVTRHSDTEIARCIYTYAHNLSCTSAHISWKMARTSVNEKNEKVGLKFNKRQQVYIEFPQAPPTELFQAAMVHPLKQPHYFYNFHQQVILGLRPILSPILAKGSCVANPVLQKEIHPQSQYIPECPSSSTNASLDVKSIKTFVLTLPDRKKRVNELINVFHKHDIRVDRFNAAAFSVSLTPTNLTAEQYHLRLTMTQFFHMARMANLQQVLVLEDDAIPHLQLRSHLQSLLSESRCGAYMLNTNGAGILMLGATIWQDGWQLLNRLGVNETGSCRNICSKTLGSFAVLYHKTTFPTILAWLNTTTNEPYDSVFPHLSRLGYPVRLAVPNLVIRDVTHPSPIDRPYNDTVHYNLTKRASIHQWKLTDYMFS